MTQGRAGQFRDADLQHMGRNDHVVAPNSKLASLGGQSHCFNRRDFRTLSNDATLALEEPGEAGQVRMRLKRRLVGEADTGPIVQRHVVELPGLKSYPRRQIRFLL